MSYGSEYKQVTRQDSSFDTTAPRVGQGNSEKINK